MINLVYVLDMQSKPLMPTRRFAKVRKMLRDKQAKIVSYKPFTIQLLYEPITHVTQPLTLGVDPGRTNIGLSVINDKGTVLYAAEVETRNKEIPKLMAERKQHRQARRRCERLKKKSLAVKNHTTKDFPNGRKLPGCEENLNVKDIINSEARFNNRKRPNGWLTPSARHLVLTHINVINNILKILPVTNIVIEANKFAFMKMDDNSIQGVDFQNGRMKSFNSAFEYVAHLQNNRCAVCGNNIGHFHHLTPKSKGGSNLPENLIGLCEDCHKKVHLNKISLKQIGLKKKYNALSVLNQSIPYIIQALIEKYGEEKIKIIFGYQTKLKRGNEFKTHWIDASYIASLKHDIEPVITDIKPFKILQFRNHNRARIHAQTERSYYYNGKLIAKNRNRRFEQKEQSLKEWVDDQIITYGEIKARQMISELKVKKSIIHYNNLNRILPGIVCLFQGNRYVMTGQITNGKYFRFYGEGSQKNYPVKNIKIVEKKSLVYV